MREIVIDTETTGLDPLNGDRIVEIGAVEQIVPWTVADKAIVLESLCKCDALASSRARICLATVRRAS